MFLFSQKLAVTFWVLCSSGSWWTVKNIPVSKSNLPVEVKEFCEPAVTLQTHKTCFAVQILVLFKDNLHTIAFHYRFMDTRANIKV